MSLHVDTTAGNCYEDEWKNPGFASDRTGCEAAAPRLSLQLAPPSGRSLLIQRARLRGEHRQRSNTSGHDKTGRAAARGKQYAPPNERRSRIHYLPRDRNDSVPVTSARRTDAGN